MPGTQMRSPAHAIAYQPLQAGVVLACAPMYPARSPRRGPSPPCRAHRPGRECLRGRTSGACERAPAAALPLALPPRRSGSARLRWRQTPRRSRSSESAHAHSLRCQSARQSCFLHARVLIHAQMTRGTTYRVLHTGLQPMARRPALLLSGGTRLFWDYHGVDIGGTMVYAPDSSRHHYRLRVFPSLSAK